MASPIHKSQGANLPHWTAEGATYSVTFRLADAIPVPAAARLRDQLADLEARRERGALLSLDEQVHLARLRERIVDGVLDAAHGECLFRDARLAQTVADALTHFDGQRYSLSAWCVMPNHVHVVFTPLAGFTLSKILHSWKSFTANAINRQLQRSGPVWQAESYDHLVRDKADFMHHVFYVRENPQRAGLQDWPWVR